MGIRITSVYEDPQKLDSIYLVGGGVIDGRITEEDENIVRIRVSMKGGIGDLIFRRSEISHIEYQYEKNRSVREEGPPPR